MEESIVEVLEEISKKLGPLVQISLNTLSSIQSNKEVDLNDTDCKFGGDDSFYDYIPNGLRFISSVCELLSLSMDNHDYRRDEFIEKFTTIVKGMCLQDATHSTIRRLLFKYKDQFNLTERESYLVFPYES